MEPRYAAQTDSSSVARHRWGVAIRGVVAIGILFAVLLQLDWAALGELLRGTEFAVLAWIPVLSLAQIWLLALRFDVLLRPQNQIERLTLVRQFLVGACANNVLPTSVGGDAARVVLLRREGLATARALSLILVERGMGVLALTALSLVGVWIADVPAKIAYGVLAFAGVLALSLSLARQLPRWLGGSRPGQLARGLLESLPPRRRLAGALAWSLPLQLCSIGLTWVVGIALGVDVPWAAYLALVPLVWIATMAPISIGGVGVRETAFVVLFGSIGVGPEVGVAMSLGTYAGLAFTGVLGGVVLLREAGGVRTARGAVLPDHEAAAAE